MSILMSFLLVGVVLGMVSVASNPSPYFGALGLVLTSGFGCGLLVMGGGTFLSMVLILIYLGGILVVFAYSAALAAEPFPEGWGDWSVAIRCVLYIVGVSLVGWVVSSELNWDTWVILEEVSEWGVCRADAQGVSWIYYVAGGLLCVAGVALLLTLFVVLELTRGLARGALRAV